ncbi:MAG: rhodanese-like domain-containing protein [Candidatus Methanoperedens sp.]|nr:rhodanese-like domain-containing protein [Candidatus Methanoperedens sp.]MCZ7405972.1 rhodanese-like domain-containing protein [Candidatus Methanoperedens sp.]
MKPIYSIIFVSSLILAAISGCISTTTPEKAQYTDVSIQQAKEMIDRGDVLILDVRTQEEYDAGHIKNSTLIPVQVLDKRLNELPHDKKILVYCKAGGRSAQASEILVNNGFKEIYNMKGGITDWTNAGNDVVK